MEQTKFDPEQAHYIVVTGIIVKDGKYLIVKRADWEKAFPGRWTVPGGKLKTSEYMSKEKDTAHHWYNVFENVIRREIKEEVNLEIANIGYVTSMIYIRPDGIPCIIVSLSAEHASGDVKLCDALTEYKWMSLEEAKTADLIDGIYEELEILDKFLKTGRRTGWTKN
ncbi:MAG: NUDIX domain-containing protein [archaeon]